MARWPQLTLLLVVLLLSYFLRIGFFTYAVYVLLALAISSRLMSHDILRHLDHRRCCEVKRAKIGDRIPVRIDLRHQGRWPVLWVLAEDLTPAGLPRSGENVLVRSLRAGQSFSLRYSLECTRRGYYQIGPLLLESGDLFGLFRRFEAGEKAHYVTVHPRILPLGKWARERPKPVGEVRLERRIFEDPSRLRGVRDYQPGDKPSGIHWRATARTGTLQTRVYESSTLLGANLVLDFFAPAYEQRGVDLRAELGVVATASLAAHIAASNQRVGFLTNGRDAADRARYESIEIAAATRPQAERAARMREHSARLRPFEVPVGRGETTLQQVLDATARVELTDFQPIGAMLLRIYPRLPRDVLTLILTPRIDPPLVDAILAMRHSGFAIRLFLLSNHDVARGLLARLLAAGVGCHHLDQEQDIGALGARSL